MHWKLTCFDHFTNALFHIIKIEILFTNSLYAVVALISIHGSQGGGSNYDWLSMFFHMMKIRTGPDIKE